MNPQNQNNKTVLYISELPDNIVDSDLDLFFSAYKDNIIISQVDRSGKYNAFHTKPPRATIIFKDHEKAEEARNALNMRRLKGKTLNIMWHEKDNTLRYNNTANIFVKGINITVKPREIYELFMKYGEILSSKICEDEDGNLLGYGYISYYNLDSAEKAIKELNKKEFKGSVLELFHFQKKNERLQSYMGNNSLYVKNIPDNTSEDQIKKMFSAYGNITWAKIMEDANKRKFAIIVYDSTDAAVKAKEGLHGKKIGNEELYVDLLQKKNDRRRILNTKIGDINAKLNHDFKDCNLYVKNIPLDLTEDTLKEIFSKYGEIKSAKIQKFVLVTKVKDELKEIEQSRGFGFVCFTSPEGAQKALKEFNGKHFPGYENKPPVIINYFMPKFERNQILSKTQGDSAPKFPLVMGPPGMGPMPYGNGMYPPYGMNYPQQRGQHYYKNRGGHQQPPRQQQKVEIPTNKEDEPSLSVLESYDNPAQQKEYLGEFLFKKIEQHPIAHEKSFTIDIIGRITGMILGIEDIKEIFEITTNYDSLTARINEALGLLENENA